jgi:5-methylcytosine-specific restriction endonuclease McrA
MLCPVCLKEYTAEKPRQAACGPVCALIAHRAKRVGVEQKAVRRAHRARKDAMRTITDYKKEAQTVFNQYIRLRDQFKPCVSCGQSPHQGQRHASHFRPRSTASQLAYNIWNCSTSCAQCNSMKSGNLIPYRVELVKRIGEDRVLSLENNNNLANYTKEYLIRLKKVFKKRIKHLEAQRLALPSGEY